MLEALQANIVGGLLLIPPVEDWAKVYSLAEELSSQFTIQCGYRSFDVLHVATAIHLRAGRFITFDKHQAGLAKAASLDVQP